MSWTTQQDTRLVLFDSRVLKALVRTGHLGLALGAVGSNARMTPQTSIALQQEGHDPAVRDFLNARPLDRPIRLHPHEYVAEMTPNAADHEAQHRYSTDSTATVATMRGATAVCAEDRFGGSNPAVMDTTRFFASVARQSQDVADCYRAATDVAAALQTDGIDVPMPSWQSFTAVVPSAPALPAPATGGGIPPIGS